MSDHIFRFSYAHNSVQVHEIEKEHKLDNIVAFSIGLIPWICRAEVYGEYGINYGGKKVTSTMVPSASQKQYLTTAVKQC